MLFGRSPKPSSSSSPVTTDTEPAAALPPTASPKPAKNRSTSPRAEADGPRSATPQGKKAAPATAASAPPAPTPRPAAANRPAPAKATNTGSRWPFSSRPKLPEKPIDREIFQRAPGRILQVGILSAEDTLRMLKVAEQVSEGQPIHFAAVDQFDDRPAQSPRLTLKEAHRRLRSAVESLQLVPGDPYLALVRSANSLGQFDFCVVTRQADPDSLERAWFYFPRMLTPNSVVMQQNETGEFDVVHLTEIARRARAATPVRRAA